MHQLVGDPALAIKHLAEQAHGLEAGGQFIRIAGLGVYQYLVVKRSGLEGLAALVPAIAIPTGQAKQCNDRDSRQRSAPCFPEMAHRSEFFLFF